MTSRSEGPAQRGLDAIEKGVPALAHPLPLDQVAHQDWNLLREDLPMPAAILKASALRNNSDWMRRFLAATGAKLAPHGKTTMAPALFDMQMDDGAWGITVATPHQIQVAHRFGFKRLFLANQLVGRAAINLVIDLLKSDPELDFYCLVDSEANVEQLASAVAERGLERPLKVLVEMGYLGGRTGCRTLEQGLALARFVAARPQALALVGVEGFEGIIREHTEEETIAKVETFLDSLVALSEACAIERLYAPGPTIFSAGGSTFYDLVAAKLSQIEAPGERIILIRAGCYLTHDSLMYTELFRRMTVRSPEVEAFGTYSAALEVWSYVQSRPEPGRVILAFGKRDVSYDHLPRPLAWCRPGDPAATPQAIPDGHAVINLSDQHAFLDVPEDSPLRVGDLVGVGISHPCLTFDKWQVLHLVDDAYTVTGSIRTYF